MRRGGWIAIAVVLASIAGCRERHEEPGTPVQATAPRPTAATGTKQILFGDLHVHTTFSADAFLMSLPFVQGEGAHPPADACDFARFCSSLDFWALTDHAETVTPRHWRETKESIRQCNAVAGDPSTPDVVAFVGWEWTQVGATPADHYGHKNVVLRETAEDRVPKRPISALSPRLIGGLRRPLPWWRRYLFPMFDWANRERYFEFADYQDELRRTPTCPAGVDTRELPDDCDEFAETPQELYEKLGQWGFDVLVIPHGTTWGLYTPPGTTFDKQLTRAQHDPEKQRLIEVYSGHGNSEEYRDWKAVDHDANGAPVCPAPRSDYEPCCWRAGEIIRSRCGGIPADECERRVAAARLHYLGAGPAGRQTIPGTTVAEWKDCGDCRDCFAPAFMMQPANSVQYALAVSNLEDPATPLRFRFGFIASSDNHTARPGTGYKEFGRRSMTEARGIRDESWGSLVGAGTPPSELSRSFDPATSELPPPQTLDFERQASFFLTGGLVAAHATGRDRDSIWSALERREVYGTSGGRILLWFDLMNGRDGSLPMGSEAAMSESPRFRVRAVGSFEQAPGCPGNSVTALGAERLASLCRNECYNPTDRRRRITRIEVVRIRPQIARGEPIRPLIEDPWRRMDCPDDPEGCVVEFADDGFVGGGREAAYYVRAIEEPSLAVNADAPRCTYDATGACVRVRPCYGDYRTPFDDDCLAPNEERAWSSPIYLTPIIRPGAN